MYPTRQSSDCIDLYQITYLCIYRKEQRRWRRPAVFDGHVEDLQRSSLFRHIAVERKRKCVRRLSRVSQKSFEIRPAYVLADECRLHRQVDIVSSPISLLMWELSARAGARSIAGRGAGSEHLLFRAGASTENEIYDGNNNTTVAKACAGGGGGGVSVSRRQRRARRRRVAGLLLAPALFSAALPAPPPALGRRRLPRKSVSRKAISRKPLCDSVSVSKSIRAGHKRRVRARETAGPPGPSARRRRLRPGFTATAVTEMFTNYLASMPRCRGPVSFPILYNVFMCTVHYSDRL
ncbi:hypothetical protein EVAR_103300_1 [Eumeta japonica]|uniref:Uncharacterized protein n=1 Tax=Eumeta variegata TaxID=151549 RepID=A0A4C1XPJ7_EUMVA|nr:hypothetical protein EVAR_103300_1 [Eumeta japonica]